MGSGVDRIGRVCEGIVVLVVEDDGSVFKSSEIDLHSPSSKASLASSLKVIIVRSDLLS